MPGKSETIAQGLDLGRDHPEVLCKNRQAAQRTLHSFEQRRTRAFYPSSVDRRRLRAGNLVVRFESAEVVKANHIEHLKGAAEARNPPLEARLGMHDPSDRSGCPSTVRWR